MTYPQPFLWLSVALAAVAPVLLGMLGRWEAAASNGRKVGRARIGPGMISARGNHMATEDPQILAGMLEEEDMWMDCQRGRRFQQTTTGS